MVEGGKYGGSEGLGGHVAVVARRAGAEMAVSREPEREPVEPAITGLDEVALATTLVALADTLVDDFDVVELLSRLAGDGVDLLGVSATGLLLLGAAGDLQVIASSSDSTQMLELLELQSNEGPCMDCYRTGTRVECPELATDPRWPTFGAAAVKAGFGAVHAFPMRHRGTIIGAMNLFCDGPGNLGDRPIAAAQALADMATIGVLHHQALSEAKVLNGQLQRALDSRIVIEQAKGIAAVQLQIDVDAAFTQLRKYARDHNLPLAGVAAAVVDGRLSPLALG